MISNVEPRTWSTAFFGLPGNSQFNLRWVLGVITRRQSLRNLVYLAASFPLGLVYFAFLVTGLVIGFATLVAVIGVPILLLVAAGSWMLGSFERELVRFWLGLSIPPPIRTATTQSSTFGRLAAHFRDQVTWTNLIYLLLKLPMGLLSAGLVFGWAFLTTMLLVAPLRYVIPPGTDVYGETETRVLLLPLLGIVLLIGGLHILNGVAYLVGRFARVMLGPSDAAVRASIAEAEASQARASAARADQSRRELIVNVSHELRTPTASIRGHVEALLMAIEAEEANPIPQEKLHNYLSVVHRESERLAALIDDLLSLARAEADELKLVLGPVNAGEVVNDIFESMEPLAWRERSVTLLKNVPANLPLVTADRERLAQVLLNLVRNAVTHTPAGGLVSISLRPTDDGCLEMIVADTGAGIPAEDLPRIFDRFYRVDASRTRASGGFGLGLAIVKDLVTAMNGTVDVTSTPGEGSVFRVILRQVEQPKPVSTPRAGPEPATNGGPPDGATTKPPEILKEPKPLTVPGARKS